MSRARFSDVTRDPHLLAAWWSDLPPRRRFFWQELLLEPGAGWLRWGGDYRESWDSLDGYLYDAGGCDVFPPARRVWMWLVNHLVAPWYMHREHLSWVEVTCSLSDIPSDPERKNLWR